MRSTSLLYKILPTSLGTCKPTFHTFYTSHLRWNSTMRRCFYHTDLEQNAVFHNIPYKLHSFNIQDYRSTRGLLAKPLKNFQNHLYGAGSHYCSASCGRVFEWTLLELRFNIIKNLLCFFKMVLSMCNLQKRLIRAAFWVLLQAMFTERLKTIGTAIKITRETTNNQ